MARSNDCVLRTLLCNLCLSLGCCDKPAAVLSLTLGAVEDRPDAKRKRRKRMAIETMTLTDRQRVPLSVTGKDSEGNPVDVSGDQVQYASSDDSVLTVVQDSTSKNFYATTTGKLGTAQITASVDPGGGSSPIMAVGHFVVVASALVSVDISAGTPEDRPPPTPPTT
jgi:hypothetical protein